MFLITIWGFSPIQIAIILLLLLLFIVELIYLFVLYNSASRYAHRAQEGNVKYLTDLPPVSVVVYAHDAESEGLLELLPALLAQKYPNFEVIVVNDGTSFEVQNAIALYECEHNNVYQTAVPETVYNVSRKKLGITLGIKAAKHDIIVLAEANSKPSTDGWLAAIARNFVPSVDIVLGYTRMMPKDGVQKGGFKAFNRMLFSLRYLAFAVLRKPYMGMGSNLAYRKSIFFANKGFSATLNLHFGDDDLLVNEMANGRNTRVELSQESIVESFYDDVSGAWNELRLRYNFTSQYLHTSSRMIFVIEGFVHFLLCGSIVALVAILLPDVSVGKISQIVALAVATLLVVLCWLMEWYVYRKAARIFGERIMPGLVPLYQVFRPFYLLYRSMCDKGSKKSNFTWQYLR